MIEKHELPNDPIKLFLKSLVLKCLRFEPLQRPNVIEILLNLHEFIKT